MRRTHVQDGLTCTTEMTNLLSNLGAGADCQGRSGTITDPEMRHLFAVVSNRELLTNEARAKLGKDPKRDRSEQCLTSQRCVVLNHPKTVVDWNLHRLAKEEEARAKVQRAEDAPAKAAQKLIDDAAKAAKKVDDDAAKAAKAAQKLIDDEAKAAKKVDDDAAKAAKKVAGDAAKAAKAEQKLIDGAAKAAKEVAGDAAKASYADIQAELAALKAQVVSIPAAATLATSSSSAGANKPVRVPKPGKRRPDRPVEADDPYGEKDGAKARKVARGQRYESRS